MASDKPGFLQELKRRHVWRVAVAYVVTAWIVLQLASLLLPSFGAPAWVMRVLFGVLVIVFPLVLVLAWVFEFTPGGVRRTEPASSPEARAEGDTRGMGRKLNTGIIVALVIAVALLAGNQLFWHKGMRGAPTTSKPAVTPSVTTLPATPAAAATAPTIPAKSIAVLPFENLSTDKGNGYFADGIQDLILTKLADIGDLKVISRTSTMPYGSHPQNLKTVGRELGVATLLEGSVQKQGNEVLINVQLINAQTDAHIWAESYTRTLINVFGVEGEVAEKIAAALNARLSPATASRLATALSGNPTANDAYLRARYFANRGNVNSDTAQLKLALPLYLNAITLAPDFALARSQLSITESLLAWWGGGGEDVGQLQADARAQAEQARSLAPDLPEAQLALGFCDYYGKADYAAALAAFAAVVKLRPNSAAALVAQGYVLRREGRFDAAIEAFQQALALDPRNTQPAAELGDTFMATGRYPEAEAALRHALALDPANVLAKADLAATLLAIHGDVPAALAAAAGDDPTLRSMRVLLLTLQRPYRAALTLLDGIPDTPDNFTVYGGPKAMQQADLYRLLGDTAKARALYAKALPEIRADMRAAGGIAISEAGVLSHVANAQLGLGRTTAALAALAKSQALNQRAHDQVTGPTVMEWNAAIYAKAGRADLAAPLLAKALASPGIGLVYAPVLLWLDPAWDPIRNSPQFQALLKHYAADKPAVIPATPASLP